MTDSSQAALEQREAEQAAAVHAPTDRHLCITAGPGAGKTHVLVERIRHLVASGARPERIAVITYTNSARDELAGRLELALDRGAALPFAGTIHQFCFRVVRSDPAALGLPERIRILDPPAAERVFATRADPPPGVEARRLFADLSLSWDRFDGRGDPPGGENREVWDRFEAVLKRQGLATFTSLQLMALELLEAGLSEIPDYVLVDEFQDTTGLQVRVLDALAARGTRITVVGDSEQSIFRFAGADPGQLPGFHLRFSPCESRGLDANGRSCGAIVQLASRLRARGEQFPLRGAGERPRLIHLASEGQQAEVVVDEIARLVDEHGRSPGQVAVLSREGEPASIVAGLETRKIPFWQPRGERFESKPHVRNLVICLEALAEPADERSQFFFFDQVVRGGPRTWDAVCECLVEVGPVDRFGQIDQIDQAVELALDRVARPRQASLKAYLDCRAEMARIAGSDPAGLVSALFDNILSPRLGLRERQMLDEIEADIERVDHLSRAHPDPGKLAGLLRQGGLAPAEAGDRVTVGTLHFSKGREWPVVFLIDLTRGVLPHRLAQDAEEERRLLHVGVSRARDLLYLCAPSRLPGRGEGPSPLLESIADLCRISDMR